MTGEAFERRRINTRLKSDLSRTKHKQLTTKHDIVFNRASEYFFFPRDSSVLQMPGDVPVNQAATDLNILPTRARRIWQTVQKHVVL